jgi:hypothetical protein
LWRDVFPSLNCTNAGTHLWSISATAASHFGWLELLVVEIKLQQPNKRM